MLGKILREKGKTIKLTDGDVGQIRRCCCMLSFKDVSEREGKGDDLRSL